MRPPSATSTASKRERGGEADAGGAARAPAGELGAAPSTLIRLLVLRPRGRRDRADPRPRAAGRRTAAASACEGGRRLRQQPGALQFLEARQVGEAFEAEMVEEGLGGAVGHRPARRAAAAAHADPAGLHQQVERALAGRDAAHLFDLGAGRRLVVGDDRRAFRARRGTACRVSVSSRRSRKPRSSAVRKAHLSPRRTRLTPRAA